VSRNGTEPLVEVDGLSVEFKVSARDWRATTQRLRAVDGVTFDIRRGETLALVGESGCGKTTVGRALLRLYDPHEGRIRFDGVDITTLSGGELKSFRRRAQMIFQDPYASLNPRMKVEEIVAEPLRAHGVGKSGARRERVREMLRLVGLPEAAARRFPHAFSGGQRQRIGIARALALDPAFVVCDEPVSALDVSIQAQVINLLKDIQAELGLTLLFIAHDLAVVRHAADRIAVMYLGQIVELGGRDEIFQDPRHPYTQSLISAVPIPDPERERSRQRIVLRGDVPSPITPPTGCRFHTRCPFAMAVCREVEPELRPLGVGRLVACHLVHPPDREPARAASS
jgi:oligopeptide/dipeptide ABC transporter ATP-binding protein